MHRRRAAGDDPVRRASRYRSERVEADDAATAEVVGGRPHVPAAAAGETEGSARTDAAGPPRAAGRMEQRAGWVDVLVDQAIARGEFDHLRLAGKPLPNLARHDPDWWLKAYVEREHASGVLPEALQLRGGPPVVTPSRDVEAEVTAWRERRGR